MTEIKRINVAVNRATFGAIEMMIVLEGLSVTEAVRHLVGYGEVVYRAVAAGREVTLSGGGLPTQRLVLLDPPRRTLPAEGGPR